MNLQCPKCRARYRLDDSRISGDSARLKCPRCQAIFIARKAEPSSGSPVSEATRAAHPLPDGTQDSSRAPRLTALLADEPREFRSFMASALKEAGFEVGITDHGEDALLLAGSHRFDLILLSVYLRRMLGINVCERLKSDPKFRTTPVILIGAVGPQDEGGLPRGLYGADDFISTRVGPQELLEKIRAWVPAAGGASANPAAGEATVPARAPALSTPEEAEIRRLARIMVSDIQMYHPEKFNRALREGTFFESFGEELGKGREIVDQRFAQVANRAQLMAAALRDTLDEMRPTDSSRRRASSG